MAAAQRIGIYGGAFDPPHQAHVAVARAAIEQLGLDELVVVPTGQAWHKVHALTAAEHRVAMARAAFSELRAVRVDDRETRRTGASYTIDTLAELQSGRPEADWFLIVGADQARDFERWKDWRRILERCTLVVAPRGDEGWVVPAAWMPARVRVLSMPALPHSATDVRQQLAQGVRVADLALQAVPEPVARYIENHHLYQPT